MTRDTLIGIGWILCLINIGIQWLTLSKAIKTFRDSPETIHTYMCTRCQQENNYPGDTFKKYIKKVKDTYHVNGFRTTIYQVDCQQCGCVTRQTKKNELVIRKRVVSPILNWHFYYKGDSYAFPYLIKFVLKGLLPTIGLVILTAISDSLIK